MEHAGCHQPGQSASTHGDRRIDAPAGVVEYYREIAPFYDAELRDRDDLGFWRGIARRHRGGRILEIGAGTGRVTETLAPAARALIAVDLSPEMLRLARARLTGRSNVQLVRADMRELPFGVCSEALFDLIVAADDRR